MSIETSTDYLAEIDSEDMQIRIVQDGITLATSDDQGAVLLAAGSLFDVCHGLAAQRGWWTDPQTLLPVQRDPEELLALCHSEVSEALEGDRKNLMDDKLTDCPMLEVELADCVIRLADAAGGLKVRDAAAFHASRAIQSIVFTPPLRRTAAELNQIHRDLCGVSMPEIIGKSIIRCFRLGAALGLNIPIAVARKQVFNSKRADHKLANRAAAGGKAY